MGSMIWIEKYRPVTLDDIVGNEETVNKLKYMATSREPYHFMLCGPPGTGKTSSILCLVRELMGEHYSRGVLELNAADERGIETVRNRIKSFAQEKVDLPENTHKFIILDEVEAMTDTAQQALRRIFEMYSSTTRFALCCNISNKVIEPIQSRCAILRMGLVSNDEIKVLLRRICACEQITADDEVLDIVAQAANGDCRKAIGYLQGAASYGNHITANSAYNICDIPSLTQTADLFESVLRGDFHSGHKIAVEMMSNGNLGIDVLISLRKHIRSLRSIPESVKNEFHKTISHVITTHMRSISILQVDNVICKLAVQSLDVH